MQLCEDSIYEPTCSFYFHSPEFGKKYVEIGHKCMIGGSFIFETSQGKITIGDRSQVSSGTVLISRRGISIGNDVIIAGGCLFYDHDSHSIYWNKRKDDVMQQYKDFYEFGDPIKNKNWNVVNSKEIWVKDKVWIGYGVTVLKGVVIGEGAVIGAGSVVTHDVEPYTVVGGNPIRVLKRLGEK